MSRFTSMIASGLIFCFAVFEGVFELFHPLSIRWELMPSAV